MFPDVHMVHAVSSCALSSVRATKFAFFFTDNSITNFSISWSLSSPHYQLFFLPWSYSTPMPLLCFVITPAPLLRTSYLGILRLPPSHKHLNISEPLNTLFLPYCKFFTPVYLAYKKCSVVFAFGISNINISTQICFINFPTSLPVSFMVLTQDPSILLSAPPQISIHYSKTDPVYTIWRQTLETGRHQIIMRNIVSVLKVRETQRNVSLGK